MFLEICDIQDGGPCDITVTIPGLHPTDIITGNPPSFVSNPWTICELFEAGRVLPRLKEETPSFGLAHPDFKECETFVVSFDYDIDSSLYLEFASVAHFDVRSKMLSCDQDTIYMQQTLSNHDTRREYGTSNLSLRFLNPNNSQIVVLPRWFKELFRDSQETNLSSRDTSTIELKRAIDVYSNVELFKYKYVLQPSDFTSSNFLSDSVFIRCCSNGLRIANNRGLATQSSKDIISFGIKRMFGQFADRNCQHSMSISITPHNSTNDFQFNFAGPGGTHIGNVTVVAFGFEATYTTGTRAVLFATSIPKQIHYFANCKCWQDGDTTRIVAPLSFNSFNLSNGSVMLEDIALISQCHGMLFYRCSPTGINIARMLKEDGILAFLIAFNYSILPEFYQNARHGMINQAPAELILYRTGSSSLDFACMIQISGRTVFKTQNRMIFVEKGTRKPSNRIKNRLADIAVPVHRATQSHANYQQSLSLPDTYGVHYVSIMPSDLDHNNHTNNTVYIRFCTDAVNSSTLKLSGFNGGFRQYTARHVSIYYSGESVLGDHLKVCFWESDSNANTLLFSIYKSTRPIFHSTIEYSMCDTSVDSAKL